MKILISRWNKYPTQNEYKKDGINAISKAGKVFPTAAKTASKIEDHRCYTDLFSGNIFVTDVIFVIQATVTKQVYSVLEIVFYYTVIAGKNN